LDDSIEARRKKVVAIGATALATLISLFTHLGTIGLVGPDEPRYAWIARAMAETGDWVTPRLYGSPWFEKPILYYWAAALGFRLHFSAEWAARLPSAFAALAAALAVAWLGWKQYGVGENCPLSPALLAPLFFSTSVGAIGFARAATPDMLFAASITLAMAAAADVLRRAGALRGSASVTAADGRDDRVALLLFGAFLGMAVLAKGPAAILLAAGAIGCWALATKRWAAGFRLLHPYGVASFCAIALPWYVMCARRNPDFMHVFIFQHNLERYLTPVFQHRQPFWFFIPITLVAMLPWTALLIPVVGDGLRAWREKSWRDSPAVFFACWALFPILFFSFSQSKLPSYILPGVPALALVIAISTARLLERNARGDRWIFVLLGVTWLGLAAGSFVWLHRLPGDVAESTHAPIVACGVVAIAGAIAVAALGFSRKRAALWACTACVCLLVEIAGAAVLPRLDPYNSARAVGTILRADLRPDRLFVYELPRSWQYGLAFYLEREMREWSPDDPDAALVLTMPQDVPKVARLGNVHGGLELAHQGIVYVPIPARPRPLH